MDSVLNQSLKDIEIICVDDGSTDNTNAILKKYSFNDERIKLISTTNNGQGAARNLALKEATGEYIAFVDADDWIESNSLELLFNYAKINDLDLLFFQMVNYIENSKKFVETELYNHQCFINNLDEGIIFNHNDTKDFLFEIPVGPVSKLYKKEFLDSNGLMFPEGLYFEDNAFFYEAYFKCSKAGFLKKQLYYRRRHDDSVTQTFDESKFDIVPAANCVLDVFIDNDKYDSYKKPLINHTFSMICEWFNKSPLILKQNFYNLIKKDFKGFKELKHDFKNMLNQKHKIIFDCANICNNYIDFLTEYKLKITDYIIFDGKLELDSNEYVSYKSNLLNKYKITVVIPIYNNEKYIHRTIMSIENQTLGIDNIEVLMIDDASTDNTYNVIKKYAREYDGFKAIHIKNGTGSPGTPRNIGLLESSSDYIVFLDHDDIFETNALEVLYDSITNLDCDFVYGTYASIDNDLPTKIVYPNEQHGYFSSISENERSIAFPPPSIWTKLFKTDFLINNDILFPTILGEDAIFVSKSLLKSEGANYLGNSLICYHNLNEKSYTNNVSYKYLSEGLVSEEYLYDLYKNFNKEHLYKIRGEGILDFYLTQFDKANINKDEIISIFPKLYGFVNRLGSFGLTPHVNENNVLLFEYIINHDLNEVMRFKGIEQQVNNENKFKKIIKRIIKKIYG